MLCAIFCEGIDYKIINDNYKVRWQGLSGHFSSWNSGASFGDLVIQNPTRSRFKREACAHALGESDLLGIHGVPGSQML